MSKNTPKDDNSIQPLTSLAGRSVGGGDKSDSELDIGKIIAVIRSQWKLITYITAGITVLIALYAFLSTPVYEADALIQIQQQSPFSSVAGSASSEALLSQLFPVAAPVDAEIQIMQSRAVLQPVVDDLHLNIDIESSGFPVLKHIFSAYTQGQVQIDVLKVPDNWRDDSLTLRSTGQGGYTLFSPAGDVLLHGHVGVESTDEKGDVKVLIKKLDLRSGESVDVTKLPDQEAIYNLQQQLTAAEQGVGTGIVRLTYNGPMPWLDKKIVNAIAAQYIHENIAAMSDQARKSYNSIQKLLPITKKRANEAEMKLVHYQAKHGVVALGKQAQAYLQEAETLKGQLSQLQLNKVAMSVRYKDGYPVLMAINQQIAKTQEKLGELDEQIRNLPELERGYLLLERDSKVYEQLYTTLLAQSQDLHVAESGVVGSARLVDGAMLPLKPVKPHKALLVIAGFVLGFLVSVGFVMLRTSLRRTIEDPNLLEDEFRIPVMGVIPHSASQKALAAKSTTRLSRRLPVLATEVPNDLTVEALRSLKTSIEFYLAGSERKIITFSGTAPKVGKSFLSVNVAHLMGQRSLLIDADMRRGHLHRYFGVPWSPGLSEYLKGDAELSDVIRQSPFSDKVDFISSGQFPSNSLELIASDRMRGLLEKVAQDYSFVFVDVPPILAVADALHIARQASMNMLVIKYGEQTLHEINFALGRFRQNGAEIHRFVFNDLTVQGSPYAGSRYGYGYGYKYKSHRE